MCIEFHAGVRGNEIADRLARSGSAQRFVGPEPFLGVSRQVIRRKMKRWMEKQHLALWGGPCSTQRQARELISGPNLATGARVLSFNRTQTRVVIGLLTGHNTLRRHLHIMGLFDSPFVGNVALGRSLQSTFCVSARPWPHSGIRTWVRTSWTRRTLGYLVWGPSGTLLKEQGSYNQVQSTGHKGPVLRPRWFGSEGPRTPFYSILFYSILFYSILFYYILFYSILFYSMCIELKSSTIIMILTPFVSPQIRSLFSFADFMDEI
jgi:hypothetical protein